MSRNRMYPEAKGNLLRSLALTTAILLGSTACSNQHEARTPKQEQAVPTTDLDKSGASIGKIEPINPNKVTYYGLINQIIRKEKHYVRKRFDTYTNDPLWAQRSITDPTVESVWISHHQPEEI